MAGATTADVGADRCSTPPATRAAGSRSEFDREALGSGQDVPGVTGRPGASPGIVDQGVDRVIVASGIVVVQRHLGDAGVTGGVDDVLDGAVAPTDPDRVFGGHVLGVMNQQIGVLEEGGVMNVGLADREVASVGQMLVVRFVIGRVHHGRSVCLEPISETQRRVIEVLRRHGDVTDLDDAFDEIVVVDSGSHLVGGDREVRILHLACQRVPDRVAQSARPVDVPGVPGSEQRGEERDPLDVVPVRVTDQQVTVDRRPTCRLDQMPAEVVRSRTAVDHDQRSAAGAHLDTGSVAAVAQGGRPRLRDRTAGPPERHLHVVRLIPQQ